MKEKLKKNNSEHRDSQNRESLLGKEAESKLLKEEAKKMKGVTEAADKARLGEVNKEKIIYKEKMDLYKILEEGDVRGLEQLENKDQVASEKSAALDVAIENGSQAQLRFNDQGKKKTDVFIPEAIRGDCVYLDVGQWVVPMEFNRIEKVELPLDELNEKLK